MPQPLPAVVPLPTSLERTGGPGFALSGSVAISGDPDAAAALRALLQARTGIGPAGSAAGAQGTISLSITGIGAPESYALTADAASVWVSGADAGGLFYGVQTLAQLIRPDGDGWVVPAVRIADSPRFAYRGVMLDVARHFLPVATVEAFIDRAAGLKFNHLHLHLTDDQGWRLQLAARPALTERGSSTSVGGDPGGFYTAADYRRIVAHAASRHMIVVPEIDVPGHTHAVGLAHPELADDPVPNENTAGQEPVAGDPYTGIGVGFSSLRLHDERTDAFLADVFGELARLTPGPYLHLGGDECLGIDPGDFAAFIARATRIVAATGKTPIAWHEAGVADVSPGTIGQYWGFVTPTQAMDEKARAFVRAGGRVILSPADAIYLDMKDAPDSPLGLTWANGPTSVERSYAWEPAHVVPGLAETDILGVEAPLWTETVRDIADADALAFPRIASAAEAAWSAPVGSDPDRSWTSFRARVGALGPLWTALGIGFTASPEIPWEHT